MGNVPGLLDLPRKYFCNNLSSSALNCLMCLDRQVSI